MKKNILIYTYNLDVGGIERSLIGLLNSIDYEKYSVDLYMFKQEGAFMKYIPSQVNLLKQDKVSEYVGIPIIDVLKKGNFKIGFSRLYAKFKVLYKSKVLKQLVSGEYMSQITYPLFSKSMNSINKEYDIALSFYWPHYFVKDKINANIKIGWIHTDYEKIYPDKKEELKMWEGIDYIAAVSKACKDSFTYKYPELEDKTIVIENILPTEFVRKQASLNNVSSEIIKENGVINLCSVGRFVEAKNFDNIPKIAKIITEYGYKIRWYLIGYGPDEELINKKIKEECMEDTVIILGKKNNPYPYIKSCDIYVQPSRFEGKAVTVREAQVLNKPVVITNFKTSGSQLKNEYDGLIVPLDNYGCAKGIISLIDNVELQEKLINNTKKNDFSNKEELLKIYKLI